MSFIHEGLRVDDFLVEERQPQYSRTFGTVRNALGQTVELDSSLARIVRNNAGQWELLADGAEAQAGGIILSRRRVSLANAEVSADPFVILERGPVIVNRDKLVKTDGTGAEYNWAAIETALVAKGFKFVDESPVMEKQTT